MGIHDLITTIYKDKEYFVVFIKDSEHLEIYLMRNPLDRNGTNARLYQGMLLVEPSKDLAEASMEEVMLPENEDLRKAIKHKQETFHDLPF